MGVDIRLIMAAAIGSLLAGGCFGGIGMLLKSSAASQSILADAMARTDTTPVNDVRSHLITSGLNSTQSEMYGETYSAQPITYKERPCLVKKEITLRVFKTHVWVQPVKRKEQGEEVWVTTIPGHWRKEERSQVMSTDVTGEPTLFFREVGTDSKINCTSKEVEKLLIKLQSQGAISNALALSDKSSLAAKQMELEELQESAIVRAAEGIDLEPFYVQSGNTFTGSASASVVVNVGTDVVAKPPDETLGTRLITKVVPVGKQVYALGNVSRDTTSPNNLVLSPSATEAFLLQYGLEGSIASDIRSNAGGLDTIGNIMMGVGGCFLALSVVSFATAGNTKNE